MPLAVILGGLFVLFIGVCFLPLSIRVRFVKDGCDDRFSLVFSILGGIIRYSKKFPITGRERKERAGRKRRLGKKSKPDKGKGKLPGGLPPFASMLKMITMFLRINMWLVRHVTCTRLIWRTRLGFEDAALTGIGGGVLWGIKGFFLSIFKRSINAGKCKAEINVTPVFGEEEIITRLDCIFKLPLGYIIIAGLRLIILGIVSYPVLKGVRLHERPSD